MAAPVITNRGVPNGIKLDDPHPTFINLGVHTTLAIWEKEVTPFGYEGGEPIMTGTMHNTRYHTKTPQDLINMTPASVRVAYDPSQENDILSLINEPIEISVIYANGQAMAVWGWARSFVKDPISFGGPNQPTGMITLEASCTDPNTGEEEGPVFGEV